jgi:hypothetical protein
LTKIKGIGCGSAVGLFPGEALLLRCKGEPAIVNQVFQAVRRYIERDDETAFAR